jgi:hypothetical protein
MSNIIRFPINKTEERKEARAELAELLRTIEPTAILAVQLTVFIEAIDKHLYKMQKINADKESQQD